MKSPQAAASHGLGRLLFVAAVIMTCQSCAHFGADRGKLNLERDINRLLVLPFENMTAIYGETKSVRTPLGNRYYLTGRVDNDGEVLLTEKLLALMEKRHQYEVLDVRQIPRIATEAGLLRSDKALTLEQIVNIGRNAGADGVFAGYVVRFRERVGSSIAVSLPASVIFELHYIDVRQADVLWSGFYAETQKSLSEDLLGIRKYFKRGGKWITAEEMAATALSALVAEIE